MRLPRVRRAVPVFRSVLRLSVILPAVFPAACDRPVSPRVSPPILEDRLAWYVSGHAGAGIPTSDATTAFFATIEHYIIAVDKASGAVRWTARPNPSDRDIHPLALVRAGNCLLVNDRDVWCLDPATGAVKWRLPSPAGFRAGYRIPTVAGGVVFTGSTSGHVFAIDLVTGELRWQTQLATETNVFSPIVRDGTVYVTTNHLPPPPALITGGLTALDAATGAIQWTVDLPITIPTLGSPTREAVVSGDLVVATTLDGYVYAYHRADGSVAWRGERASVSPGLEPRDQDLRVLGSNDSFIFVGSSAQGSLTTLRQRDGSVAWTRNLEFDTPFWIRIFDGDVWVTTIGGRVLAFDPATGIPTERFDSPLLPPGREAFSAVAADDRLIYLAADGGLFAFRRRS